jgi:hypothetical protein
MTSVANRGGMGWSARLLIAVALILAGAAGAAWALARYDDAARFLGVSPRPQVAAEASPARQSDQAQQQQVSGRPTDEARIAQLETRLRRVENAAQQVAGSAGRADALLVAFAARRAIDRGVALGYLEPLLVDRFGAGHARAVATIVTGSHSPVQLSELISEYRQLGPALRSSAPNEGWWTQFKRELGSLIEIRRADRPSNRPDARYEQALTLLEDGEVDSALAETMRLPGASRAEEWIRRARQYVTVHRALDEIESAALLGRNARPSP